MKTINLIFGIHNHQPVGNFDFVIEDAYQHSYDAFLTVLERHPGVRMAIHNTGILLDWYGTRHPQYIDRIRALVERNQVEILTSGYYEPILCSIPDSDKIGQIRKMSAEVERLFGVVPRGMWMAERVWEPQLPAPMRDAGVEFTILDASHFRSAGIPDDQTLGYFLTEEAGRTLAVFPISEDLRHMIPYKKVEEIIAYLQGVASEDGKRIIMMSDDGEKYGVWPGSYKHCYEDGWIERFFTALEQNAEWIHLQHFGECLDKHPPIGRVYLPTASYSEMLEWALPADSIERYEDFVKSLKQTRPSFDGESVFVHGGFWRNFLTKYDEANNMHKRMLRAGDKVRAALEAKPKSERAHKAQDAAWQSQCNCPYWHGVFGGLYAAHLRSAVYRCMIEADALANEVLHAKKKWIEISTTDFDCDGHQEVIIETPRQILFFKPSYGGSLIEHDVLDANFNVLDVLARRKEAYHRKLREIDRPRDQAGDPASIHERITVKEAGLDKLLFYDWHRRASFLDHFLAPDTSLEAFAQARYREDGDFVNQSYFATSEKDGPNAKLTCVRRGALYRPEGVAGVRIEKVFVVPPDEPRVEVEYTIRNEAGHPMLATFGVEFCANFLAPDAHDRYYKVNGAKTDPPRLASSGAHEQVTEFGMVDEYLRLELRVTIDAPMNFWRFPLETVSVSEAGFERTYQGSVLFPHTSLALSPGEAKLIRFTYEVISGK